MSFRQLNYIYHDQHPTKQDYFQRKLRYLEDLSEKQSLSVKKLLASTPRNEIKRQRKPLLHINLQPQTNLPKKRYKCEDYMELHPQENFTYTQKKIEQIPLRSALQFQFQIQPNEHKDNQIEYFKSDEYSKYLQRLSQYQPKMKQNISCHLYPDMKKSKQQTYTTATSNKKRTNLKYQGNYSHRESKPKRDEIMQQVFVGLQNILQQQASRNKTDIQLIPNNNIIESPVQDIKSNAFQSNQCNHNGKIAFNGLENNRKLKSQTYSNINAQKLLYRHSFTINNTTSKVSKKDNKKIVQKVDMYQPEKQFHQKYTGKKSKNTMEKKQYKQNNFKMCQQYAENDYKSKQKYKDSSQESRSKSRKKDNGIYSVQFKLEKPAKSNNKHFQEVQKTSKVKLQEKSYHHSPAYYQYRPQIKGFYHHNEQIVSDNKSKLNKNRHQTPLPIRQPLAQSQARSNCTKSTDVNMTPQMKSAQKITLISKSRLKKR